MGISLELSLNNFYIIKICVKLIWFYGTMYRALQINDLRKLIKYEERMGINTQQNDYFESLFRRTTASYRAKIDKENDARNHTRLKYNDEEMPTTSKQAAAAGTRRVLQENNHSAGHTKTSSFNNMSYDTSILGPINLEQSRRSKGNEENKDNQKRTLFFDSKTVMQSIEKTLTQILQEIFSQKGTKDNEKERITTSLKSLQTLVEETLNQIQQKRLLDVQEVLRINSSDPGSFKAIIEDVVAKVLQEKLYDLAPTSGSSRDVDNLNQDLQQKLNISRERSGDSHHKHLDLPNTNKSLDTQALVDELLAFEDHNNENKSKKYRKSKSDKENSSNVTCIKRLRRSPRRKPEWQDPGRLDAAFENPRSTNNQRSSRPRSPTGSSTAHSGRSRYSSSVMIPRSASQGRTHKPNSDPVALYQYYKNEWQHFRNQIPGETMHSRLRWHVRQRMLDPK